jgi:hypothetical protein
MTSSRSSRLLAVALLLAAGPAAAQTTTPANTQPVPAGSISTSPSHGVEVGTLDEVTPDYGGPLEEGAGGFPIDMWKGTDRALVERLLPQLAVPKGSPAMRDLARRLLLSNAEAPAGRSGGVSLFAVRAERLAALGDSTDAAKLLALQPAHGVDPAAARLHIGSLLLAGDVDGACKAVDETRKAASADPDWQKAQVFCQLQAGQGDQAALGLDVLREENLKDPAFFALADALGGNKSAKLDSLPAPSALDLAMLSAAKLPLPKDAAGAADPAVQAAIARDAGVDPATRLAAAEQAAAAGSLPVDELKKAYAAVSYSPGDLGNAVEVASHDPGPGGRALLFQATGAQREDGARARILQAALGRARQQGGYLLAVQVNLAYLLPLTPAPDLAWLAEDAGRALYAAGHYEQAGAWLEVARAEAAKDPQGAAAAAALAVYARIAGMGKPLDWDPATVQKWRDSQARGGPGADAIARLVAVFEGLGEPIGASWSMIGQRDPANAGARANGPNAAAPDPALWFNLGDAAHGHRIGETVLLALYALGEGGPARANPILLSRAIDSLRQIGLDAEARAIATEAAVAAGV